MKKNQVHVCLWLFCFSFDKLIIDMGVTSTFLLNGGTWFPLTMKLSHKSTILTREKTVPSPLSMAHTLPLQGWPFNQPAAWSVLENYFKGDVLLLFNIFLITSAKLFSCAANFQISPVWVKGQIRSFGTRILLISHLDFCFVLFFES